MKRDKRIKDGEGFDKDRTEQDEDILIFKILLNRLKRRYNISSTEVLNLAQEEIVIPSSIFNKKLSPSESIVKYLRENLELDYNKIAELLNRNRKAIWQAYKNANKKLEDKFEVEETEYNIPISVFEEGLSVLETIVSYLKVHYELSYREIAELIKRDERTVWTVYQRAIKKK